MVTMYTPSGVYPSPTEKMFRRRAIQLGEQYSQDVSCKEAVVAITETLMMEGLQMDMEDMEEIVNIIEDQLQHCEMSEEEKKMMSMYHSLVWRTAGDESWTLTRTTGQCRVLPYIPKLLLGSQMKMSAEKVIHGESLSMDDTKMCSRLATHINRSSSDPELWTEINLLEFIFGSSVNEHLYRSQTIVPVMTCKDSSLNWRDAQDNDRLKGEDLFVSELEEEDQKYYARSDSDVRKLYECRPRKLKTMVLGQFACLYRVLNPSDNGYEATKEMIDPETSTGPQSAELIAGTEDSFVPTCIQLKNETIMKMRVGKKAVLHLLNSGRYANQLLWQPWNILENVSGKQIPEETALQKKARLMVLPMSVYPKLESGDDME